MKDALIFIVKSIVTVPADVVVEEAEVEGVINYTISVNTDDIGRIIGKEGKVIKAIRTIMRVMAIQQGVRVRISVLSDTDEKEEETTIETSDDSSSEEVVTQEETETKTPDETEETPVEIEEEPSDEISVEV